MNDTLDSTRKRYLEDRIVFCANCDGNRVLQSASVGLVCATCASKNWMYLPNALPHAAAVRPAVTAVAAPLPDNVSNALMEKVAEQKRARPRLRLVG